MGVQGATLEPKQYLLPLCNPNTPILRILSAHLFWPIGYRGMRVRGATPKPKQYILALDNSNVGATLEPKQYFLALCICAFFRLCACNSNTPILHIQKHLFWPIGYSGMRVWGATREPKRYFWHCAVQTPPSQVYKNTFAGLYNALQWQKATHGSQGWLGGPSLAASGDQFALTLQSSSSATAPPPQLPPRG